VIDIEAFRIKDGWKGDLSDSRVQPMVDRHMLDCAIHDEGPCTCGTQEERDAMELEEAGLRPEDFE